MYDSHLTLKMGQTYGPEKLVKNQRNVTLGNNPKVTTSREKSVSFLLIIVSKSKKVIPKKMSKAKK
jgi:hypothetical protein